jgi:hypothetical protein
MATCHGQLKQQILLPRGQLQQEILARNDWRATSLF